MIKTIGEMESFFNSFNPSLANGKLRENRVKRMEILLERIGNPESYFSSYHIAGSKGKGTTASYLSRLIEDNGTKCGLYMSPHVYDVRERFTNATQFFSNSEYIDTINELDERIRGLSFPEELGPSTPTTFELYTAYSYLLFKNTGCEEAVIETGLGGRLDATNTLNPKAVIFTNIELEHTDILGNTFEEIAREKLGIMRNNTPTFCMQERLYNMIMKECPHYTSSLFLFDDFDIAKARKSDGIYKLREGGTTLKARTESQITLFDALYSYRIARKLGRVDETKKDIDLTAVNLPARFEEIKINDKDITIIIDGAHTPTSCKEVLDSLNGKESDKDNRTLIFSAAIGKKIREIGLDVFASFKSIIITGLGEYKKSNPEEIFSIAKGIVPNGDIELINDARIVLDRAISKTRNGGYILSLGSFYLAARIKEALKESGYVD